MLFQAFKRNREERPNDPAFLIAAGDRYLQVSWKQYADDISVVLWIIERHASNGKIAILGENSYEWMVLHAACLFSSAIAVSIIPMTVFSELLEMFDTIASTQKREAKSPALCPPIPSATIKRFGIAPTDSALQ